MQDFVLISQTVPKYQSQESLARGPLRQLVIIYEFGFLWIFCIVCFRGRRFLRRSVFIELCDYLGVYTVELFLRERAQQ